MKYFFIFLFLISSVQLFATDSTRIKRTQVVDSTNYFQVQLDKNYQSIPTLPNDRISELTLFVNGMNNIISSFSILLGIVTIIISVASFLGFRHLKNDITKEKESIQQISSGVSTMLKSFEKELESSKSIKIEVDLQNKYIESSNMFIYKSMMVMATKLNDKALLNDVHKKVQVIQLFTKDPIARYTALQFLSQQGSIEHLSDLEYVAQNDSNNENRKFAREIIGIIKGKNESRDKSKKM
jgi:hypothetical protein